MGAVFAHCTLDRVYLKIPVHCALTMVDNNLSNVVHFIQKCTCLLINSSSSVVVPKMLGIDIIEEMSRNY